LEQGTGGVMANAEKVVDYVSAVLSSLIAKPVDILVKPLIKPVTDNLKAWLGEKETRKSLLEAASKAEDDFRERAKEQFGNDKLSQAVVSFPLHNGELFQAALQSLPSHLNETILESHLSNDLTKYWPSQFSPDEIRAATALYIDCLRLRLLRVKGFQDVVTRLAILRTDSRTEDILNIVNEILAKLSSLTGKEPAEIVFRSLHQLPQPPADFTGRELLIAQLIEDFDSQKSPRIIGLGGMGGIGKTALGLVVAHKVSQDYPDAQIFLDLKGTTMPLSAMDSMRHVILSFEPTMDLRALDEANMSAAYQSVLHGRKALLFFDNARSAEQLAPLRPPETCAMLVTSRWTFSVPGLRSRRVDMMSEENAQAFLLELCPRIGEGAAELAKACAYLPLALRIAGSFLEENNHWSVKQYLERLNDRKERLSTLEDSHSQIDLSQEHPNLLATFELSYRGLSEENQKRWRTLGVFPASFDANAAGAIWDLKENETAKLLGSLRRYSLLDYDETSSQYNLHDLLADYALSQMEAEEKGIARISHSVYYSKVLGNINQIYLQGGENILLCLRLYDAEWMNIVAGQRTSVVYLEENSEAAQACNGYAWQGSINSLRLKPKHQIKWIEDGMRASRVLRDRKAEGAHLGNLGLAYSDLGDARKAIEFHEQALVIHREIGDRRGEGNALGNLGNAYYSLGDARKAIEFYEQRIAIAREIGDRLGEGNALFNMGLALYGLEEKSRAIDLVKQAMEIYEGIESPTAERALNALREWGVLQKDEE
jgi:tetratricopeptide (TPR) repeat protein